MLPDNLLTTLRALSLNERPLPTAAPDTEPIGKDAFELGQRVQGTVIAEAEPGVFKVRVLNQLLHMPLPAVVKSGDVIELQVMSLQPRLTFSMAGTYNPLSTPQQLSDTGRLLAALTQRPTEQVAVRTPQNTALIATPADAVKTGELAGKLREALSQSGLFYESHQAQWVSGLHSTAQLLQEPQNLLRPAVLTMSEESATQNTANPSAASAGEKSLHAAQGSSASIPEHLRTLVQQQLNTLETRQLLWQGQAWPQQEMSWEIHDERGRRNAQGEIEAGQWATQVRMELPGLGEVAAMLRFNSSGLSLTLDAASPETRALFGRASAELVAALDRQGLKVSSAVVSRHDDAPA